ncbi:MAG: MarC family protein [Gammaproteobacteria bacterium]|nr:MarC family protein [Gammaproteobacteria bacterium]
MDNLFNNFVVLFIVVDPVGVAWLFAAMTHATDRATQRRTAARGVLLASAILFTFFFIGVRLLHLMGISLSAFKIAGGVLLFLLSIDMVFARHSGLRSTTVGEQREAEHKQDISVFPLAFPLIAGPGALTTVLLMTSSHASDTTHWSLLVILLAVLLSTYISLVIASDIVRALGETGANVISRLLGVMLAALAVQYVIDGVRQSLNLLL